MLAAGHIDVGGPGELGERHGCGRAGRGRQGGPPSPPYIAQLQSPDVRLVCLPPQEKPIGSTHFSLLPYMKILPQVQRMGIRCGQRSIHL